MKCMECGQEVESETTLHTLEDCEAYKASQNIVCPFCGDDGFDKIGLKYHLMMSCEEYDNTKPTLYPNKERER